ncbi:tetratricopeptide repeat-containing sensor histidine kinase [Hyunsoonleella pacifica]|uniref:Oxygen sensor histidine kinase NreB n=1 Tax=Hyunsoonleella pacifica TaxID=1080224 RepID=A0A4Q9FSX7_9FLAO|nr:ATP-binding protein [Hyunsoonleella pacifica]TBN17402.1 hypothetical protein EYD46_03550 [Hyunsoonleella pacifica]
MKTLDSIQELRKLSKNQNLDTSTRFFYAKTANEISEKTKVDSTILLSNKNLAVLYFVSDSLKAGRNISHKTLKMAKKLNDSTNIGYCQHLIGWSYLIEDKEIDSSYIFFRRSIKTLRKTDAAKSLSDALTSLAYLQYFNCDYSSSVSNLLSASNILQKLPKDDIVNSQLTNLYITLALNSNALKDFNKAVEYYQKALETNKKVRNSKKILQVKSNYNLKDSHYLDIKINLAEVYKEKQDYVSAIGIYKELLNENSIYNSKKLLNNDPLSYIAILNNLAYNKFLSKNYDKKSISQLFSKAYQLADSLNVSYMIAASGNDISEFYASTNKKDSAKTLAKRSYVIGKQIKDYKEISRALLMLSKLETGEKGKEYLYELIKLNDSLLDVERNTRDKFARIKFETDEYIHENKKLATQNILIVIIGLIVILIMMLIHMVRIQIAKNEKLKLEGEQQKVNEDIYRLMLRQQSKIEEGILQERFRISEELHDGVINKLVGSRLGIEFLSFEETEDVKKKYSFYIKEIQKAEKDIRDLSHGLRNTKLDNDKDFMMLLKSYLTEQNKIYDINCQIHQENQIEWPEINDQIKINLFRVLQEAMHNIMKHAKANLVNVNFSCKLGEIYMTITDNGSGFDTETNDNTGIGLKNIAARVSKLGGKFMIDSKLKQGTILTVIVPIENKGL